jgi:hypothetical protein
VYEDNTIKTGNGSPNYYYFAWEGRNRSNRFVGAGTYLVELKYFIDNQDSKEKWLRVGVHR